MRSSAASYVYKRQVLLRKQTKKTASRLLEDASTGQDLSELIEQLLTEWIQQQS
jgi:hypothetical protein